MISSKLVPNPIKLANLAASSITMRESLQHLTLKDADPELYNIIKGEQQKLTVGLNLIASENYTSRSVYEVLGSVMTNKYSPGYPGERAYGGIEYMDQSEKLCQQRALEAFHVTDKDWGVNVQTFSGTPANFYIYSALVQPFGRILSMHLSSGGHLSHGYETATQKVSYVSKYFDTMHYKINPVSGIIDYDQVAYLAEKIRPQIIMCGASAYPRKIDYKKFKEIAKSIDVPLVCDMAHISGLVAGQVINDPFEYSDVISSTTHKTLRGPRGSLIFYRLGTKWDLKKKIDTAVYPGHQGGAHNHTIAAVSHALHLSTKPEFKKYIKQVLDNSIELGEQLKERGFKLITFGTDNHIIWVDAITSKGIDGTRIEYTLETCNMYINSTSIPEGESSAGYGGSGGLRIGTPAMTTRGMVQKDMAKIAEFIDRGTKIAIEIQKQMPESSLKDFKKYLAQIKDTYQDLKQLKSDVTQLMSKFEMIY